MGFTTMIELVELIQLIGCVMFIAAMRWLSTPQFANRGNLCSAGALLLIVGVLLCSGNFKDVTWIVLGMLGGIAGGFWIAQQTQSTAIQQHVVLLNGFGAGASLLVAGLGFGSSPRNTIEVVAAVIAGLLSGITRHNLALGFDKIAVNHELLKIHFFHGTWCQTKPRLGGEKPSHYLPCHSA